MVILVIQFWFGGLYIYSQTFLKIKKEKKMFHVSRIIVKLYKHLVSLTYSIGVVLASVFKKRSLV